MQRHDGAEYRVLRNTIRTRATIRPVLVLAGVAIWAVILIAVLVLLPLPVAAAIPLMVLLVTFEVIRPLHFGAERIGRYLQVFYEEAGQQNRALSDTPSWERVAISFGAVPGAGGHPLFVPGFFLATIVNYVAVVVPGPLPVEMATMAVPHLAFIAWLIRADRDMRAQRAEELKTLRALREGSQVTRSPGHQEEHS